MMEIPPNLYSLSVSEIADHLIIRASKINPNRMLKKTLKNIFSTTNRLIAEIACIRLNHISKTLGFPVMAGNRNPALTARGYLTLIRASRMSAMLPKVIPVMIRNTAMASVGSTR